VPKNEIEGLAWLYVALNTSFGTIDNNGFVVDERVKASIRETINSSGVLYALENKGVLHACPIKTP